MTTTSLAALLESALRDIAGDGAQPVSMALDYGSAAEPLTPRAWVERATRSLMFVQAEALDAEGRLAGAASAVFRRPAPATA